MKPFDLEKAKAGDPICTRDGRSAEFVAHRPDLESRWKVVAIVDKSFELFMESGYFHYPPDSNSGMNLFMAPTKKTYWFGSWPYNAVESCRIKRFSTHLYDSKEAIQRDWPDKPDMTISSIEIEE